METEYQARVIESIHRDNAGRKAHAIAKWGDKLVAYIAQSNVGAPMSEFHFVETFAKINPNGRAFAKNTTLAEFAKRHIPQGGILKLHETKYWSKWDINAEPGAKTHPLSTWEPGCTIHHIYAVLSK